MIACPECFMVFIERGFNQKSDFINNLPETSYLIMFRSLIIIAALALVYLLIRNRLQNRKSRGSDTSGRASKDTVQCAVCETFIPQNEAIFSNEQTFCCKQHQHDWQNKQE